MTIKQQGGIFGRNPTFNQVNVDDGGKIVVGTDGDLEIYHSGTQTYIQENGTGDLRILGGNIRLMNASGDETFITCIEDDYVALRHNNNEKLRTVSGGIDVSGNVILDSGSGIDFSATSGTGTSELFDDYEEGDFTATLTAPSGSFTLNSALDRMSYTKIGRMVFITGMIGISSSTATGVYVELESLPFAAADLAETSGRSAGMASFDSIGAVGLIGKILETNTKMRFTIDASTVTGNIYFNISYVAA